MGLFKFLLFLELILVIAIYFPYQEIRSIADARPLPFLPRQSYKKAFATLGVVCKCCDGVVVVDADSGTGGHGHGHGDDQVCATSWEGSNCTKLHCQSWKFR